MDESDKDVVIPVVQEELRADAVPVVTGGVRVTKRVESQDEIVEQELRKSHVDVKRVKTNRVVDGPQPVRRAGNTLIVPVVSEVLKIEKQWIVTEEIHITERQEKETVQDKVTLNHEEAQIERLDSAGNVVSSVHPTEEMPNEFSGPASILQSTGRPSAPSTPRNLPHSRSILEKERND